MRTPPRKRRDVYTWLEMVDLLACDIFSLDHRQTNEGSSITPTDKQPWCLVGCRVCAQRGREWQLDILREIGEI